MNTQQRMPVDGIKVGKRLRADIGDVSQLAASIDTLGLLQPVVVRPDGTLIAGERRLRAVRGLGWQDVPVHVVANLTDALSLLRAERDENTCRKDFAPSEAVALGVLLEELERGQAKSRQLSGLKKGKQSAPRGGKLPPRGGKTRDRVAAELGLSGRSYEKAKAVVNAATAEPERFAGLAEQMDSTGNIDGAYKLLMRLQKAEAIAAEPPPLPDGKFRVVVVDPPWEYSLRANDATHRAANPYPSMTLDQIKNLPVPDRAAEDCILWLWTTNAHLVDAHEVVRAWGFTARTILTWMKDRMGTGDWLRGNTEHCWMATRGNPVVLLTNQTTGLHGPLREHSRKPDEFYAMVESLCPGSKLELFARQQRPGWTCHGSETSLFAA